jgi:hypothetical protein
MTQKEHSNKTINGFLLLILFIAAVGTGYLFATQKINDTEKAIRLTENEISRTYKEIANLRNQEAHLKGSDHIREQISRFNLDLENYKPGQVVKMRIFTNQEAAAISARYERNVRTALNYNSR